VSNCNTDGDSLHNLNFERHATCKKMLVVEENCEWLVRIKGNRGNIQQEWKGENRLSIWLASLKRESNLISEHDNRDEKTEKHLQDEDQALKDVNLNSS